MDGTRKVSRLSASTRSRLQASSGESPWDLSPLGLGVNLIPIMRSSSRAALIPLNVPRGTLEMRAAQPAPLIPRHTPSDRPFPSGL